MLLQYVRDKERNKVGLVVALDKDKVGWSLCKVSLDRFNKDFGLMIAKARAEKGSNVPLPGIIKTVYNAMIERARSYYKVSPCQEN